MNGRKKLSALFAVLFLLTALGTVVLCIARRDAGPVIWGDLTAGTACTEELMEAVAHRDYPAVRRLMSGNPVAETEDVPGTPLSALLWDAYGRHFSYEFQSDCYANDYGLFRDVRVTALDITALMEDLQLYAGETLAEEAVNAPDACNADGTYTQDFIQKILVREAKALLKTDAYTMTRDLTLQLSGSGGKWGVCQSRELTDLIVGGMGGF